MVGLCAKAATTWTRRLGVPVIVQPWVSRPAVVFSSVLAAPRLLAETRSYRSFWPASGVKPLIALPDPTQSKIQALSVIVVI